MKRKKHAEHVNLERWLVSYADFITLLFAFFVIMFAMSQADAAKFRKVSSSLQSAFEAAGPAGTVDLKGSGNGTSINPFENLEQPGGRVLNMPAGKTNTASSDDPELQDAKEKLEESISLELGVSDLADKVQLMYDSRGLVIRLAAKDFFDDGDVAVKPDLLPVLDRIGRVVSEGKRLIRIEGHSDPREEELGGYPSGWELSAARASWVVRFLVRRFDIDPKRIGAAGYSHFRPLTDRTDDYARGKNRRVEVIILNNKYER